MMHATFFQKLILSVIAGAVFGGLVEFYKTFIEGADQALNGKTKSGYSATGKR